MYIRRDTECKLVKYLFTLIAPQRRSGMRSTLYKLQFRTTAKRLAETSPMVVQYRTVNVHR